MKDTKSFIACPPQGAQSSLFQNLKQFLAVRILLHSHVFQESSPLTRMLVIYSPRLSYVSGKSSPVAEVSPVTVTPEEMAEMEKRNELRLRIKEEHLAALQTEGRRRNRVRPCFQWSRKTDTGLISSLRLNLKLKQKD